MLQDDQNNFTATTILQTLEYKRVTETVCFLALGFLLWLPVGSFEVFIGQCTKLEATQT